MQCVNFDDIVNGNKNLHNKNWSYIPDHPYRILIIGGSESGKSNALLKLIENLPINKREGVGIIILTIINLLSSIQMTCAMFTRILIITILIKKIKY